MLFCMSKKQSMKLVTLVLTVAILSAAIMAAPASALVSQNATSWFWTSDTNVSSTAVGDVNGDSQTEIITAGYFNDGTNANGQLIVWNPSNLVAEKTMSFKWNDTQISSIAIANITGGAGLDIVTGGSFFDGTRWNAQLIVWNGVTLVAEKVTTWFWTSDTEISSVAVANITGGSSLDIVTGGAFFDGTRWNSQLIVWNASTLVAEKVTSWFWTSNTYINSVAVANITGGASFSIVTGGTFNDGIRNNAQLIVWNAATLTVQTLTSWFWTSDTEINSVASANVTGGTALSIITGGDFFDGLRSNAQLIVWNGATLTVQSLTSWYWTSDTKVASVAVANMTGGASLDIVTAGSFNDGIRSNAQVIEWNGASVVAHSLATWFSTSNTDANAVALGNFGLAGNRIVVGGSYFDTIRSVGQLSIWG
jgi:hypothetical protein